MADKIQVVFIRGCNDDGIGGTPMEDVPSVTLKALPDGTPLLNIILAAFADAYPIPQVPTGETTVNELGETVDVLGDQFTKERWLTICWRSFTDNIVAAFRKKLTDAAAADALAQEKNVADSSYVVG